MLIYLWHFISIQHLCEASLYSASCSIAPQIRVFFLLRMRSLEGIPPRTWLCGKLCQNQRLNWTILLPEGREAIVMRPRVLPSLLMFSHAVKSPAAIFEGGKSRDTSGWQLLPFAHAHFLFSPVVCMYMTIIVYLNISTQLINEHMLKKTCV